MAKSQNGYGVLFKSESTRSWLVPGSTTRIRLRDDWTGFLLIHFLTFFNAQIEKLDGKTLDDWGGNVRPVTGQTSGYSNHASYTAADANALKHPRGKKGTYSKTQRALLALRLRVIYRGLIRAGEFYVNSPCDGMHFEINAGYAAVMKRAKQCAPSPYGKAVLRANPEFAKANGYAKYL